MVGECWMGETEDVKVLYEQLVRKVENKGGKRRK